LKPARANSLQGPISKIPNKKRVGGVALISRENSKNCLYTQRLSQQVKIVFNVFNNRELTGDEEKSEKSSCSFGTG
jgi:hypothetical protein